MNTANTKSTKRSSRPPVVMIHGAFCGGWAFEGWAQLFRAQGYAVTAPTLRHHDGGGRDALAGVSLIDYADDLQSELAALGGAPILIGHSMGGLLAQMLAARVRVRALVLLAPSPPYGVLPSTAFEVASAQALYLAGDFWNKALKPAHWVAESHSLDLLPDAERASVLSRFVPESGLATFEIMHWPLDPRRASQVDARAVTAPILSLVGEKDRINPPATVRRVAARYKTRAVHQELPGHSHWLIGEPGWQKIAQRALRWLDEVLAEEVETA